MKPKTQINYFTVKDARQKLNALITVAQKHLTSKEQLFFLVSDKTTQDFISELFWNHSKNSFLAHEIYPGDYKNSILQITLPLSSYMMTSSIFNLTSQPLSELEHLKQVYELEDLSHKNKKIIFEKKFKYYQEAGYTLCSN